jgi:4-amino-4-deoxy-L-arabinose transferase-like glycosyltransferase
MVTIAAVLFAVALLIRLLFVAEVLDDVSRLPPHLQQSDRTGYLTPDSRSYLDLAGTITRGGLLEAGSLSRPPGYPLFLWACGSSPRCVLGSQAIVGATIPVLTFALCLLTVGNLRSSALAGALAALSPTGIGLTGLVLADLLVAALFVASLVLIAVGARRDELRWVLLAGVVTGLAGLVKPVLGLWPGASVAVWWLLRRSAGKALDLRAAAALVAVPLLMFSAWASRNQLREGVFALSEIGPRTVRLYWAVVTEAVGRSRGVPLTAAIHDEQSAIRARLSTLDGRSRMRVYRTESLEILRKDPGTALAVFMLNIYRPGVEGWDQFPRQLPLSSGLVDRLRWVTRAESVARRAIRWLGILGFFAGLAALRRSSTAETRRLVNSLLALWIPFVYVTLSAGVTFWTGPRIVYPVESVSLVLAAGALPLIAVCARQMAWRRRPSGGSSSRSG